MIQLIYASAATVDFSNADLKELLRIARKNNESLNISGMLLYHEKSFLQILEGEEASVFPLFDKIHQDSRHNQVKLLLKANVEERSFQDWMMGFYDTSGHTPPLDAGYVDFFRGRPILDENEGDRARKVLMQFREGAWRQRVNVSG